MREIEAELLAEIENTEGVEKYKALTRYSNYYQQSDLKKSISSANEAIDIARQLNRSDLEIKALDYLAYAYLYHSDFKNVNNIADRMYSKSIKINDHNQAGNALILKGRASLAQSDISQAKEYYLKALEHCLKDPQPIYLMTCYNNLGTCYQTAGDNSEALGYFQLALDEAEKFNFHGKDIFHMNIGCIQYSEKKYQAALESFFKACKYFEANNMLSYLADAYLNISLSYYLLNDSSSGSDFLNRSYKIKEELEDYNGICKTFSIMGETFLEIEDHEKALLYFQNALDMAIEHNLEYEKKLAYQSLLKFYEKTKDFKKLSETQKILMELTRAMNEKAQAAKLLEMETKYKTEIYKLQTKELNAKNKAMQEQINKLKEVHDKLKQEVEDSLNRISEQGDLLTSQSRMALIGEMISLIAHQWKQPLNIISILVQAFEEAWEFDEMDAEYIEKQVKMIMDQIFYMSETITDFRNFFKSDVIQDFDLKAVLEKAIALLDYMMKQSNITCITDLEENCYISGNPNEIIQVVMNIINNARDAMLENKVPSPLIKITLKKTDQLEISIFNKGSRIPEDILEKLFEPYFSTKGEKGTGIGLYICKMIVEHKYKGNIKAVNQEDGVEFKINLQTENIDH